jgi:hypothetical protein
VLLIRRGRNLATVVFGFAALLYVALFAIASFALTMRWPGTSLSNCSSSRRSTCASYSPSCSSRPAPQAGSKSAARC